MLMDETGVGRSEDAEAQRRGEMRCEEEDAEAQRRRECDVKERCKVEEE